MARLASGKASRTARMTAAIRHRHSAGGMPPLVYDDRYAKLFLDLGSLLIAAPTPVSDWALGRTMGPVRAIEGEVLARSRYVEDRLKAELASGLDQVIVLGAGFDTMALHHVGAKCRFFEVDHPATQQVKRGILAKHPELTPDLAFVPVDFATDDLAEALLAAGFSAKKRALVSWLGVTMYLEQAVTMATLATLRPVMAKGSSLIFDAYPRGADIDASERPMFAAMRAFTATRGEPMRGSFDTATFAEAVGATGWRIAERIDGAEMQRRWFAHQPRAIWPPRSVLLYTLEAV
jgi:methyltransferase (TIGR00027 family)